MQQKKITLIVIRDKRRLFSLDINFLTIKVLLVTIILILILLGLVCLNFVYAKKEAATKVAIKEEKIMGEDIKTQTKHQKADEELHVPMRKESNLAENNANINDQSLSNFRLAIEGFEFKTYKNNSRANFKFLLKNKSTNVAASGFLYVVLKEESGNVEKYLVFPKDNLNKAGIPQNFKGGEYFFIKRQKTVTKDVPVNIDYDLAEILVFSDVGKLVLRQKFHLKYS